LTRRALLLLPVGLLGLGIYAWLAVQVYRSQVQPKSFEAWSGRHAWVVGPPADPLNKAAIEEIDRGLESLSDTTRSPSERLDGFRARLEVAEGLLVRSLRAQPAQARAVSRLATVRWELDPPHTDEARHRHLSLIELSSQMAPNVPEVQMDLGRVLLLMGHRDAALEYLQRAVTIAPDLAAGVVALMGDHLFSAPEILDALPPVPETLVALRDAFEEEGRSAEYLSVLADSLLQTPDSAPLLRAYASVALRGGMSESLIDFLDSLGPRDDPAVEAVRLQQRSRGLSSLGDIHGALSDARKALALEPGEPAYGYLVGDAALAAGETAEAIRAYRETLSLVARRSGGPSGRARLYRKIGEAQEAAGRPHDAYDSYRKALALVPDEPIARRRVEQMEAEAGVR